MVRVVEGVCGDGHQMIPANQEHCERVDIAGVSFRKPTAASTRAPIPFGGGIMNQKQTYYDFLKGVVRAKQRFDQQVFHSCVEQNFDKSSGSVIRRERYARHV